MENGYRGEIVGAHGSGKSTLLAALAPIPSATAASQATTSSSGADIQVCDSCAFTDINSAVAAAASGDRIEVVGGSYAGPLVIDKPLSLIGIDEPVIDGNHTGTIVRIMSSDVTVQGFILQNSGQNFDKEDSAVYIEGERVHILDNQMINTLFGVNASLAQGRLVS